MEMVLSVITEFWGLLCEMAPYLLFGFFVAGLLSVVVSPELIEKHLGGKGLWPIIKASLFGIPLPLCSCGVIPVAASLRKHGASRGATTGFLLSTPQTGIDSIFVTLSLLGPVFAVFRPLAALLTGIFGGVMVESFGSDNYLDDPEEHCHGSCCSGVKEKSTFMRIMKYGFVSLPREIGRALILGLLIAGAISAFIPEGFFSATLGTGFLLMFVMMLLGIPVYVCATASIPVAAAMMMKGVTPGAALVFLMTGPATNAAAITTLWKIMGRRSALIYLGVVAVSSLACGITLNLLFDVIEIDPSSVSHWMMPPVIQTIAAIILIVVLGAAMIKRSVPASAG